MNENMNKLPALDEEELDRLEEMVNTEPADAPTNLQKAKFFLMRNGKKILFGVLAAAVVAGVAVALNSSEEDEVLEVTAEPSV